MDEELPGTDVKLTWRAVTGAAAYRVQMSTFIGFDEKLVNRLVDGTELQLPSLPPERYVWRVCSVDREGHEGEFGYARRFDVREPTAPRLPVALPAKNAVIEFGKTQEPVIFRWRGTGERYQVVVARSPDLRRHVELRRTVRGKAIKVQDLDLGVHYWMVYELDKRGKRRRLFSPVRRLVIRRRKPPKLNLPAIQWK